MRNKCATARFAIVTMVVLLFCPAVGLAQGGGGYDVRIVADGLNRPTGIAVQGSGTIYYTEVPTPGVPGSAGGMNSVSRLSLESGEVEVVSRGEPEPVNLALGQGGNVYWTCKTAGVILERRPNRQITLFLGGLVEPNGISVDGAGHVYFTQLPTPGVPGGLGGMNTVDVSDGSAIVTISAGEPEPTDVVVGPRGTAYWTCKAAGVILSSSPSGEKNFVLTGLDNPVGIALDHRGDTLYWTELPTPGIAGPNGGRNQIWELDLATGMKSLVLEGHPEPRDVAVARNGNIYWTCSTAGVIAEARRMDRR